MIVSIDFNLIINVNNRNNDHPLHTPLADRTDNGLGLEAVKNITMQKINYTIKVRCWKDKQTKSWLIYSRKFKISAYGKTKAKAKEMFKIILEDIIISTKPRPPKT